MATPFSTIERWKLADVAAVERREEVFVVERRQHPALAVDGEAAEGIGVAARRRKRRHGERRGQFVNLDHESALAGVLHGDESVAEEVQANDAVGVAAASTADRCRDGAEHGR